MSSQAVLSLLEQHKRYTEAGLCDYLQEQFPEVDPAFRSVIGIAAAQYMLLSLRTCLFKPRVPGSQEKRPCS